MAQRQVRMIKYMATISAATCLSFFLFYYHHIDYPQASSAIGRTDLPHFDLARLSGSICNSHERQKADAPAIPNIVHYIWLLRDPLSFEVSFKVFLAVYSAHAILQPDVIYIHTDADPSVVDSSRRSGSLWTQRLLALPRLVLLQASPINVTDRGVPLEAPEHRSDFLRLEALLTYGGIYLDTDTIVLRDMTDLRRSGFSSVVGVSAVRSLPRLLDSLDLLSNGVMMAAPGSLLINLYLHASHHFFDGGWITASTSLLTDLANRVAHVPGQVLILQSSAFSPASWEIEDEIRLYVPNLATPDIDDKGVTPWGLENVQPECEDVLAWLKRSKDQGSHERWAWDFANAYVLHAFDNFLYDGKIEGWNGEIDLEYVVARRSIYARVVYPYIEHAVENKIILPEELRLEAYSV